MSRRTTFGLLLVGAAIALPVALAGAGAADTCLPGAPPGVPCLPVDAPVPLPSASVPPPPVPLPVPLPDLVSPSPSASPSPSQTADGSAPGPTGGDGTDTGVPLDDGFGTGTAPEPALGDGGGLQGPATAPLLTDGGLPPDTAGEPGGPAPETAGDDSVSFTPVAASTRATVAQSVSGAFALVVGVLLALPLLLAAVAGRAARTNASTGPGLRALDLLPAGLQRPRRDGTADRLAVAGLPADLAAAVSAAISEAVSATVSAVRPAARTSSSRPSATRAGAPVNPSGTNRLYLGLGALAVAALAGFVGWYQLSANPNVNQQLPYLASAGVIVVIASALGGALLVGDQLRGDDRRIEDLEDAVRELAAALGPMIEAPARRPAREISYVETEVLEQEPVAAVRRSRNGAGARGPRLTTPRTHRRRRHRPAQGPCRRRGEEGEG